jgi:tRNA modification GTPase
MADFDSLLNETTIIAVSTPPGRGGIGVVRLSGTSSRTIGEEIATIALQPRHAHYAILLDDAGERVDDAVLTWFQEPHSYTGEDVVEIATHGSPVVLDWLVRRCVELGAQPARPGEFTERAFLRGRLDLTQAEAVRDLIDAQTLGQAKLAAEQMSGSISHEIRPVKQALVELIAALEAGIDFAEDDIDLMPSATIVTRIAALHPPLRTLLDSFANGRLMREGMRLAIVGRPNAGKSSLFNRLLQRQRAIVTATPGTTRDVISERIALDGIPVELLDTAGLRETDDEVERIGVGLSREAIADADAVLLVIDASRLETDEDASLNALLNGRPVIEVHNKIDLVQDAEARPAHGSGEQQRPTVRTSTRTGEGIDTLQAALLRMTRGDSNTSHAATLTNLRQKDAVERAHDALLRAQQAALLSTPHEMLLLDLYEALRSLDELTGQTTPDDVLHLIFSTFCIGK